MGSERLGHSSPAFTMTTYQHVLRGLQAEAATTFQRLIQANGDLEGSVERTVEDRKETV